MQSQEAKYMAVVNWVMEQIQNGVFQTGDKLPSENELSREFELSRQTVRHAIDVLEQKNMLTRTVPEHCSNQYLCRQLYFSSRIKRD